MLRLSFLLLALVACSALGARIPRDADANPEANPDPKPEAKPDPAPEAKADPEPEAKAVAKPQSTYTDRFDNIDIDQILRSERLLKNYLKCLKDQGPCTPDAAELKRLLPDALENECSKCTEKQKAGSEKVIQYMIKNKPKDWEELQKKYDPTGRYKVKYTKLAEERGIKVPA